MPEFFVVAVLVAVLTGVALGWYLRRVTAWCPGCGHPLICPCCGRRPAWFFLSAGQGERMGTDEKRSERARP